MKLFLLLISVFMGLYNVSAQYNTNSKHATYGGDKDDIGNLISKGIGGGFLLGGSTRSFGAGSEDIVLIKYDNDLTEKWNKIIGWTHSDIVRDVEIIDKYYYLFGNVWDIGKARYDMYLQKTNANGDLIWKKGYGTHYKEFGFKMKPDNESNLILLGYSRGFELRGDLLIIKTDTSGNEIWKISVGYDYDDYGFDLDIDDKGNIYLFGSKNGFFDDVHANFHNHDADFLLVKLHSDGNIIWKKTFGNTQHDFGKNIKVVNDFLFISGSTQKPSYGSFDYYFAKLDTSGAIIWARNYGSEAVEVCNAMGVTNYGDIILGGTKLNSDLDLYILSVDNIGNLNWEREYDFGGNDKINDILINDSSFLIVGATTSINGDYDINLSEIDYQGDLVLDDSNIEFDNKIIQIRPNPAKSKLYIYSNSKAQCSSQIYTLTGKLIKVLTLNNGKNEIGIDFAPGVYILKTKTDNLETQISKFIVN